mmetsp:Transcript_29702/g.85012  ORF Transcript_29702/g.85012 Transcript_29702/m.85012 type:complete len:159 (-) Transcript_29702:115-591(-)
MTARRRPILLATVAALAAAPAAATTVGTCPCPVFQTPSKDCEDCHRVRCRIGGWEIHRQTSDTSWAYEAAAQWTKNCNAYTRAAPWTSMQTACKSVLDACGVVCGKIFPPDASCNYRCALAQGSAVHSCLSFPWPDPPAEGDSAPPAAAAASPGPVYT